ncbi:MAG: hypothetical protein KatS3mg105_2106 [Gemmatales bacterium]|nr:MAG: hypothetical protein KatS3mg105_2106 [Gemmatales bacterium]
MRSLMLGLPVLAVGAVMVPTLVWLQMPVDMSLPTPTVAAGELPTEKEMRQLAETDPIAFFENCIRRYNKEVKGYTLTFQKQERINGVLQNKELIKVAFRDKPHSVYFEWLEGARKAERVLYVEGENKNKQGKSMLLARPRGAFIRRLIGDIVEREVDGADAKQSGRLTLDQFGFKKNTERTLASMKMAKERGALNVKFLGEKKIEELNNRVCYVFRRHYDKPELDGIAELTIFVDKETWLQTGNILKDKDGNLIAEYYFRDVKLNPKFDKDQFTRKALMP